MKVYENWEHTLFFDSLNQCQRYQPQKINLILCTTIPALLEECFRSFRAYYVIIISCKIVSCVTIFLMCSLNVSYFSEHVVSIIASMLRNCQGGQRQRLLAKFTENDLEKVDRLLELHFKYMDKVDRTEKEMEVREQEANFRD